MDPLIRRRLTITGTTVEEPEEFISAEMWQRVFHKEPPKARYWLKIALVISILLFLVTR